MNFSKPYWFSSFIMISTLILSSCAFPEMATPTPVVFVDEDAVKALSNQTDVIDPTKDPTENAEETSDDASGVPRLIKDKLCLSGPGQDWLIQSSLSQDLEVHLVGIGLQPGWLVISHPNYPEIHCWVPEEFIDLPNPDILTGLPILPIPSKP